jgi:hypothetical protein
VSDDGRWLVSGVDVQGPGITIANDKTVVLTDLTTGDQSIILREGQPTGDGDNFDNLAFAGSPVQVNNSGTVLSAGDTDGDTQMDSYLALDGSIIAREGMTVGGNVLNSVGTISLNNVDQYLVSWSSKNGGPETLYFGEGGDLTPVISVGDTFTYFDDLSNVFLDATIDDIESDQILLTDDGRGYFVVEFTDGDGFSEFKGVVQVVIPEPGSAALAGVIALLGLRRRTA